jgi:hypothetical protein
MAELGWTGFLVPEANGGAGFGMVGLGQVLEAAGRTLAASPLISTALIGASALDLAGTPAQRSQYLSKLLTGDLVTALATDEGPHHDPSRVATTATRAGDAWTLSGTKSFVLDGHVADLLIVSARAPEGITLFLVDAKATSVTTTRLAMADSRNAARIALSQRLRHPAGHRRPGRRPARPACWTALAPGSPPKCSAPPPRPSSARCNTSRTASSSASPSAPSRRSSTAPPSCSRKSRSPAPPSSPPSSPSTKAAADAAALGQPRQGQGQRDLPPRAAPRACRCMAASA